MKRYLCLLVIMLTGGLAGVAWASVTNSPFEIHVNKGKCTITQSKDGSLHYRLIEPKEYQVRVKQSEGKLRIHAPNHVKRVEVEIAVPEIADLTLSMGSGHLNIKELNNPFSANVKAGQLRVEPVSTPKKPYKLDLSVNVGSLFFDIAKRKGADIAAEVNTGNIEVADYCRIKSEVKKGWVGKEQKIVCKGSKKRKEYDVRLNVKIGSIKIGK